MKKIVILIVLLSLLCSPIMIYGSQIPPQPKNLLCDVKIIDKYNEDYKAEIVQCAGHYIYAPQEIEYFREDCQDPPEELSEELYRDDLCTLYIPYDEIGIDLEINQTYRIKSIVTILGSVSEAELIEEKGEILDVAKILLKEDFERDIEIRQDIKRKNEEKNRNQSMMNITVTIFVIIITILVIYHSLIKPKEFLKPTKWKIIIFLLMSFFYLIYMYISSLHYGIGWLRWIGFLFPISQIPFLFFVHFFVNLLEIQLTIDISILPLVYSYLFSAFVVWLYKKFKWKSMIVVVGLYVLFFILTSEFLSSHCHYFLGKSFNIVLYHIKCLV